MVKITHVVSNHTIAVKGLHKLSDNGGVRDAVRGVSRNENVDVTRGLLSAPVASHDLDPELWVNCQGSCFDIFKDLAAFVARNARTQVLVEVDTNLLVSGVRKRRPTF